MQTLYTMHLKWLCGSAYRLVLPYLKLFIGNITLSKIVFTCLLLFTSLVSGKAVDTLVIPVKPRPVTKKLTQCEVSNPFLSDTLSQFYFDDRARNNRITICPPYPQQRIRVDFLDFDLAVGDTLFAYDGFNEDAPLLGKASGRGIAAAFGGRLYVSFSRETNPTSCITFVLRTDGNGIAGRGWRATVQCTERNLNILIPDISSQQFVCAPSFAVVDIPGARLLSPSGPVENDSIRVRIFDRNTSEVCHETILSSDAIVPFPISFGAGAYLVEYTSLLDTTLTGFAEFEIVPPSFDCKETYVIDISDDCAFDLELSDIINDFCPPEEGVFHYNVVVRDAQGNFIVHGNTINGIPDLPLDIMSLCGSGNYFIDIQKEFTNTASEIFCVGERLVQSCTTEIIIEDGIAPTFVEPTQTYILTACEFDLLQTLASLPIPAVTDNCSQSFAQIESSGVLDEDASCANQPDFIITWVATDDCGNITRRYDTLRIVRPATPVLTTEIENITLNCEADTNNITNILPIVRPALVTGLEINGQLRNIDTLFLSAGTPVCDYQILFNQDTTQTDCGREIIRYWSLQDFCTPDLPPTPLDTQIISVIDTTAPIINCTGFSDENNPEQIDLLATDCQFILDFSLPTATDNCDDKPIVKEFTVETLVNREWSQVAISLLQMPLGIGVYRVGYVAEDACSIATNRDTCYHYFNINDTTAPSAICRENLTLQLNADGTRVLSASEIDSSSFDNCGIALTLIRRSECLAGDQRIAQRPSSFDDIDFDEWSQNVTFDCCDLRDEALVELLTVDGSNNFDICSISVRTIDEILPTCSVLPPGISTCRDFDVTDLGRPTDINGNNDFDDDEWLRLRPTQVRLYNVNFGNPFSACTDNSNCQSLRIEQQYQLIEGRCGSLRIRRRYRAVDASANVSPWTQQVININYQPDWTLTFPSDVFTNCDADKIEDPLSPIQNGACDDLTWTFRDEITELGDGVVSEIVRTFNVVNQCLADAEINSVVIPRVEDEQRVVRDSLIVTVNDFLTAERLIYTQVIRFVDTEAPFLVLGDVDLRILGKGDAEPLGEEDQTLGEAPFECDDVRTFAVFARDCNEPSTAVLSFNWEFLRNEVLVDTGIGSSFMQTVLPDSLYTVNWSVRDVFGNQTDTSVTYQFVDAIAPTMVCRDTITAIVDEITREIVITTDSLNANSFDNCDDQRAIQLFLWHESVSVDTPNVTEAVRQLPTSIPFGCIENSAFNVLLFGIDRSNNFNFCNTHIAILDNPQVDCNETMFNGTITNRFGEPIEAVDIEINANGTITNTLSKEDGTYDMAMTANTDYFIRPVLDQHPLNGVTTYDLILLNKHILGEEMLQSPYQYIAADVNRSNSISTYDLVQLRRLILGQLETFPDNDSWRFITADYEFQSTNPLLENFTEQYELLANNTIPNTMDFTGVKIGDLNGDAVTMNSQKIAPRQAAAAFSLQTNPIQLKRGKTYRIPFYASDLQTINGFQATLKFHDLILTNFFGGVVTSDHVFGRRKEEEGHLTVSWHSLLSHDNTRSLLFTLEVEAMVDGTLQELLTIISEPTPAEAYRLGGQRLNVELDFIESITSSSHTTTFQLYPNAPNPFTNQTIISFFLPEAAMTALSVFDIHGKVILQTQRHYETGTQQITFNSDHFPTGTYFCQVATPFGVATQKMTLVRN